MLTDPWLIAFCVFTFLIAGTVKGILGIGLPTTAMAIMTLVIEPTVAIALVTPAIIATNAQQFFTTGQPMETAYRYRWIAIALSITIFITALTITRVPQSFLVLSIGVVMCLFAIHVLMGFRLPIGDSIPWQVGVGVTAGICGGLSAIWAPPVAMFLISQNVNKEQFISGCGFLFMIGSLPLAGGLLISGVLNSHALVLSLICLAVALIAFRIGAKLRQQLANEAFRKIVLITFLIMGARLVWSGLST
ncbi:MAG: membrane protein [marine bacterium B5-7]|nr:MAG: membrane protein [marine bacterium B5-7]